MTDTLLSKLDALAAKATARPWEPRNNWEWGTTSGRFVGSCSASYVEKDERDANAELIVALVNAYPALAKRLRAAEAVCSEAQWVLQQLDRSDSQPANHINRGELRLSLQAYRRAVAESEESR